MTAPGAPAPRPRVLVVDDSREIREQIGQMLEGEFDCSFAESGAEGLGKATREAPDAIVSDLEMPGLDGVGMMRALRAFPRTSAIPVIIVTGTMAVARVNECRSFGCAGFALKPLAKEYLVAKLRLVLRPKT